MAASPLQLQELIRNAARRDRNAFAALYADTAPKLFGIALRIVGRRAVAEEILQESFITVWQRAGDYDPRRGSAMAWLIAIVRHSAIDQLRRQASRPETPALPDELLRGIAGPDAARQELDMRALQRCLDELDEMPRRAVLLAYAYGLTREELAARLAVPIGTVKSWIRRSVERLQRCLDA